MNERSPRSVGTDHYGNACRLGDLDGDGHPVGWIDEEGVTWIDRRERDLTFGVNVLFDAFVEHNYHGGVLGCLPDADMLLVEADVPLEYLPEVLREFGQWMNFYAEATPQRAVMATWN